MLDAVPAITRHRRADGVVCAAEIPANARIQVRRDGGARFIM